MSEHISQSRRGFLRHAAMTIAAAEFSIAGSADARSRKTNLADATPIKPGMNRSFGSLKRSMPKWEFDEATFDRSAAAFENPDHVSIVIHNTAGGSAWRKASRSMTNWRSVWPKVR
jgi:hypothetical protein